MRRGKSEKCGFCFDIIRMVFLPIIAKIFIPDYDDDSFLHKARQKIPGGLSGNTHIGTDSEFLPVSWCCEKSG